MFYLQNDCVWMGRCERRYIATADWEDIGGRGSNQDTQQTNRIHTGHNWYIYMYSSCHGLCQGTSMGINGNQWESTTPKRFNSPSTIFFSNWDKNQFILCVKDVLRKVMSKTNKLDCCQAHQNPLGSRYEQIPHWALCRSVSACAKGVWWGIKKIPHTGDKASLDRCG